MRQPAACSKALRSIAVPLDSTRLQSRWAHRSVPAGLEVFLRANFELDDPRSWYLFLCRALEYSPTAAASRGVPCCPRKLKSELCDVRHTECTVPIGALSPGLTAGPCNAAQQALFLT